MSKSGNFGRGVTGLREEVTWVTSYNKVCYFVTYFSPNSEVCENPTGSRSWFFTSVGLEVFPCKNLMSIIFLLLIFAEIPLMGISGTNFANRA